MPAEPVDQPQQSQALASNPSIFVLIAQVSGLLLAGVGFQRGFAFVQLSLPLEIYSQPSFTLALLAGVPWLLVPVLVGLLPLFWRPTQTVGWQRVDNIGGLQWVAFCMVATLCWSYSAYPINYYHGQDHLIDRWLLVGLMLLTLRSPLLIPLFVFEMMASRGQFRHPISSLTPIGDELPVRVLGMITAAALINLLAENQFIARFRDRMRNSETGSSEFLIPTPVLVFATLCLVGSYYGYAGVAKLTIGEGPLDWALDGHLENLFVGAYLKGWQIFSSENALLAWVPTVARLSPVMSLGAILVECGMVFILVRRRGTLALMVCVLLMHLGIVVVSGVFFWKWLVVDIALGLWLWFVRNDRTVDSIYSPRHAVISVLAIMVCIGAFGLNEFTWWNTKWYSVLSVEAKSRDGSTCTIDNASFEPYMLIDYLEPKGSVANTIVFGSTLNQKLMRRIEGTDAKTLRGTLRQQRAASKSTAHEKQQRNVKHFMQRYFANRNDRFEQTGAAPRRVFPFLISAPLIHLTTVRSKTIGLCGAPINEVSIRHVETFFTGNSLVPFENQLLQTVKIPVRSARR